MEYNTNDIQEQEQTLRNDLLYDLLRENRPQPPRESRAQVRRTPTVQERNVQSDQKAPSFFSLRS